MKFEQQSQEIEPKKNYIVVGKDFKKVELNRDDILEEAALSLENDSQFPDSRGEKADHFRAKRAIRQALKKHGADYFIEELEKQIGRDAYEVLDLFKK